MFAEVSAWTGAAAAWRPQAVATLAVIGTAALGPLLARVAFGPLARGLRSGQAT